MVSYNEQRRRLAGMDLLVDFPFIDTPAMQAVELEQLGVINKPVTGMRGRERMMQKPPEGVIRGASIVDRKTESEEAKELFYKAKEQRIRSLERQDRIKKEIDVNE